MLSTAVTTHFRQTRIGGSSLCILESLPEEERVAYTTIQTLVYRLEQKGALRKVKKIGNAQLFEPAIDQSEFRGGLVQDLLDLFGGSPRLLVSNLLESGTITLKDLKALQDAAPGGKGARSRGGKGHARAYRTRDLASQSHGERASWCGVRRDITDGGFRNGGPHGLLFYREDVIFAGVLRAQNRRIATLEISSHYV